MTTPSTTTLELPAAALSFFARLQADNTKTFWLDHRDTYEQAIRAPLLALVEALAPEFGAGVLLRPYRDVRFGADKSPYKTHATVVVPGAHGGALYLRLSAEGLWAGGGHRRPTPPRLARYRAAVLDETAGRVLARSVEDLRTAGFTVTGDRLTRSPRGVGADHPRIELLRHRELLAGLDLGPAPWLDPGGRAAIVASTWRRLTPLTRWLNEVLGSPSGVPTPDSGRTSAAARPGPGSDDHDR